MSTPRINSNDPKWTAYVLGELDEGERAAVERLLDASEEARALVSELKAMTATLEGALTSDVPHLLTPPQRTAVRMAAEAHGARQERLIAPVWMQWRWGLGAVAAAIVAAVVVTAVLQLSPEPQRPAAREGEIASAPPATAPPTTASPATESTAPMPNVESAPTDAPAAPAAREAVLAARPAIPTATGVAPVLTIDDSTRPNVAVTSSTLTGSVRDTAGSVLPGVTVTAVNSTSGSMTSTKTDDTGRYTFAGLEPGQAYRVTTALPGFQMVSA